MPTSLALDQGASHFAEEPRHDARDCFVLPRRQRQVAAQVTLGATNREIGRTLCLSERSVEAYVSAILGRLCVRSRTQLAVWAVQHGLTSSDQVVTLPLVRSAAGPGSLSDLNHTTVLPRLSRAAPGVGWGVVDQPSPKGGEKG